MTRPQPRRRQQVNRLALRSLMAFAILNLWTVGQGALSGSVTVPWVATRLPWNWQRQLLMFLPIFLALSLLEPLWMWWRWRNGISNLAVGKKTNKLFSYTPAAVQRRKITLTIFYVIVIGFVVIKVLHYLHVQPFGGDR